MTIQPERVRSTCGRCGQTDTHPKHHPYENPHHFDCGREFGCITCDSVLRASGELHGEALTRFMSARAVIPCGS